MRQRAAAAGGGAAELLDRDEPLAMQEQEAVVAELRATLVFHARGWRTTFAALGFGVAAVFAWFALWQAYAPWVSFRHHSGFKDTLPAGVVAVGEAASAGCMASAAAVLLRFMPLKSAAAAAAGGSTVSSGGFKRSPAEGRALNAALAASVALAVFWIAALHAAGRKGLLNPTEQLRCGWLPAAPLAFALLAGSVVRQYADSGDKLKALEAQMYRHEGA